MSPRRRAWVLLAVLLAQAGWFAWFLRLPLEIEADNVRYEEIGFHAATGKGFSISWALEADPAVLSWTCEKTQAECEAEPHPTAIYPPGYPAFIALIYTLAGRSLAALIAVQFLLHLGCFVLLEKVSAALLGRVGYAFVMAVGASYPFLAHQAVRVMSDSLHVFLLFAALAAWVLTKSPIRRALLFGLLFGAATMVRPYSVVALPILFLWPRLWQRPEAWRAWLVGAAAAGLVLLPWTIRNAVVLGQFVPFSTTKIGASLYQNLIEAELGPPDTPEISREYFRRLHQFGDATTTGPNARLSALSWDWLRQNPEVMIQTLPFRAFRLWVSRGSDGGGPSRLYPVFIAYLGGLLLLGLLGFRAIRERPALMVWGIVILTYWAFLLISPAESRRTLALRLPLLVFAGWAVEWLFEHAWLRALRARLLRGQEDR